MGTADESRLAGLLAALRFHRALGPERVHERVRELRTWLVTALRAVPGLELISPAADLAAGMVSFRIEGIESLALQEQLAREANIRTRVVSEYGYGWMRLSPHVYTRPAELERTVALLSRRAAR
jgi:selenocysteine lyase/cysteine desulfurase